MNGAVIAVVAAIVAGYGLHRWRIARNTTVLSGPCPRCGDARVRRFEKAGPKSRPTACGACVAYLRVSGTEIREEAEDASNMIWRYYVLSSEQYLPAVQKTNRGYYKFEMPPMCAVCGDAHATHHREIGNGDSLGTDLGALGAIGRIAADVADVPSRQRDQRGGSTDEPTSAEQNSRGLSQLKAPVCAKHTSDASVYGDALEYSSGKLEFASYRYYKAFCEMNHIERAAPVKG